MATATGFQVDGLSESVKLLSSFDKGFRKQNGLIIRKAATALQAESRRRMKQTPGVFRSGYPTSAGAIGRRATATKGTIFLSPNPRQAAIFAAEAGSKYQFIPFRGVGSGGRFQSQGSLRRRTFPVFRGGLNEFKFPKYGKTLSKGPGWIVGPVLRKHLGKILQETDQEMFELFAKTARRVGVPR